MKKLSIILAIIFLPVISHAATLGYLGNPIARYWDSTGRIPLTGGKVVTCEPNSVCGCSSFTSKTSYQDSAGLITNTNPVILDGTATAHIWLNGAYKITVCDRFNVVQFTEDNVSGVVTLSTTATTTPTTSEWVDSGLDSIITGLSTTMFSVQGDVRNTFPAQIRIKATVASGISYATVTTSTFDWTGGAHTTIAVVLDSIASPLTGITKVSTGILSPVHTSIPILTTNNTWTGSQTITGNVSITSNLSVSVISIGTITSLSSSVMVTNLNSQYLGGYDTKFYIQTQESTSSVVIGGEVAGNGAILSGNGFAIGYGDPGVYTIVTNIFQIMGCTCSFIESGISTGFCSVERSNKNCIVRTYSGGVLANKNFSFVLFGKY